MGANLERCCASERDSAKNNASTRVRTSVRFAEQRRNWRSEGSISMSASEKVDVLKRASRRDSRRSSALGPAGLATKQRSTQAELLSAAASGEGDLEMTSSRQSQGELSGGAPQAAPPRASPRAGSKASSAGSESRRGSEGKSRQWVARRSARGSTSRGSSSTPLPLQEGEPLYEF
mmetsp:Transcript_56239/g.131730  ORF Transcript_56239/g.131730 Transcript_56239/m.131730 type:complete len:176 (-) Transcript_56239:84-611(-)